MDPKLSISLTQKGEAEVKTRANKLNIKYRSILLLLEKPQTLQFVAEKVMFPHDDLVEALAVLARDGFLHMTDANMAAVQLAPAPKPSTPSDASTNGEFSIHLHEDIINSEARFLLVNYCVDTFGTKSQSFVDALGLCKNVAQFSTCAKQILDLTKTQYPHHLEAFQEVIQEVNKTAM